MGGWVGGCSDGVGVAVCGDMGVCSDGAGV